MEWEEEGIHFVALEWDNDEPPSYEELFGNPVSSRAEFAGIVQVATLALSVARTTSALQQENIRNPERRRRCYEIETSEEVNNNSEDMTEPPHPNCIISKKVMMTLFIVLLVVAMIVIISTITVQ